MNKQEKSFRKFEIPVVDQQDIEAGADLNRQVKLFGHKYNLIVGNSVR